MPIQGLLSTDEGIRDLRKVICVLTAVDDDFQAAVAELSSFFARHLEIGFLPFTERREYPSSAQRQVYQFIGGCYQEFIDFASRGNYEMTEDACTAFSGLLTYDRCWSKAVAIGFVNGFCHEDVTSVAEFQDDVYDLLIPDGREIAMRVLTNEFPNSTKSTAFTRLFDRFVRLELNDGELMDLVEGFNAVLSRVDDRLVTYDFLRSCFVGGSHAGALALSHLVNVSVSRAVDVENVYGHAFRCVTRETMMMPQRAKFFETLAKILASPKLPTTITTAFAVKVSRMLTCVPVDAQLDIVSFMQYLVRAHEAVHRLLTPTDAPVSDVYGDISECKPQTLWELIEMKHSPVPVIADTARKLGQFHMPPDYGSFDLKMAAESCKPKMRNVETAGNWLAGLDRTVWNFH